MELLLEANEGGETALHRAVVNEQTEMARLLADKGGPELLALEDTAGATAESIARSNGDAALAKLLAPAPPRPAQKPKPAKAGRK
mmetsp:Transcript_2628/g.5572  ORF Transcript_2628/g.5572 Transcript_2628/m.5572 type:complete len:85 (-) Transcript_2628:161-415(-)